MPSASPLSGQHPRPGRLGRSGAGQLASPTPTAIVQRSQSAVASRPDRRRSIRNAADHSRKPRSAQSLPPASSSLRSPVGRLGLIPRQRCRMRHSMYDRTRANSDCWLERCSAPKTANGMAKHKGCFGYISSALQDRRIAKHRRQASGAVVALAVRGLGVPICGDAASPGTVTPRGRNPMDNRRPGKVRPAAPAGFWRELRWGSLWAA
jgi:hypothetical protein